jgi:hypothetical protein
MQIKGAADADRDSDRNADFIHVLVDCERYPLEENFVVGEHNQKVESGELSPYDFILPNGKRLGQATRTDVLKAAKISEARAAVHAAAARHLARLATRATS